MAGVDFVHYVSYLDGVELQRGLRYESSTFEVNNTATGARTVSLYYYEDCCSGTAPAYRGWDVVFAPTPTGSDLLCCSWKDTVDSLLHTVGNYSTFIHFYSTIDAVIWLCGLC